MGLLEFRIIFENPNSVYEPGQTVNGIVILKTDSVKKIRGNFSN